jgi:hypothetical protein
VWDANHASLNGINWTATEPSWIHLNLNR